MCEIARERDVAGCQILVPMVGVSAAELDAGEQPNAVGVATAAADERPTVVGKPHAVAVVLPITVVRVQAAAAALRLVAVCISKVNGQKGIQCEE